MPSSVMATSSSRVGVEASAGAGAGAGEGGALGGGGGGYRELVFEGVDMRGLPTCGSRLEDA